ncbi:MAG: CDP-alcohol phosphatidyltransferase family protein [Actinomycetota bacterium]
MLDATLRPMKDRLLAPVAAGPAGRAHPIAISVLALVVTVAAAIAAARGAVVLSVGLWLLGRILDGLDGQVARATGRQSDLGGLLDFLFDTIGYAAVPIGLAVGVDDRALWIATAVVLATFYVNAVSLGHVAAILEKRALGAIARGESTSVTMPRGVVEGAETMVFFALALSFPEQAHVIWSVMAIAVVVTVTERTIWASRTLHRADREVAT